MKKLVIKQDEENPIPQEVMAAAIIDISNAMKKISQSRLSKEAIIVLIKDKTNFTKGTIKAVIDNLEDIERLWLKKK